VAGIGLARGALPARASTWGIYPGRRPEFVRSSRDRIVSVLMGGSLCNLLYPYFILIEEMKSQQVRVIPP
jgi:hypothetical protein